MMTDRIGVFLSSVDKEAAYHRAAVEVGEWIGSKSATLVYGGSASGLMEVLAQSVVAAGGRCLGVVPDIIRRRGLVSTAIDIEFPCVNVHDRKEILLREADFFVALPGGIGTIDEVMTVLGSMSIGESRKRMVLYNVGGCWDSLIALLRDICDRGLAKHSFDELVGVATSIEELEAEFARL